MITSLKVLQVILRFFYGYWQKKSEIFTIPMFSEGGKNQNCTLFAFQILTLPNYSKTRYTQISPSIKNYEDKKIIQLQ